MSDARTPDQELEHLLDEAVAEIAHRLRTPLTVIVGYAELLRLRDDETTRREAPLRIQEAAERLLAVVDDTLAAAESRAEQELLR